MRHMKSGRSLSRRREHRKSMLANMAASLIKNGRIRTTDAKAKEVRPFVERLVTFAKRGDLHARRVVLSRLRDSDAVKKLFDEIGPKYTNRFGGYTRLLKLGFRQGDNSPVSLIEFVEEELPKREKKSKKAKSKDVKPAEEKAEAAEETAEAEAAESDAETAPENTEVPEQEAAPAEEKPEAKAEAADAEPKPEAEEPAADDTSAEEDVESDKTE